MVDGDEYLIKLVRERSALWNKDSDDYKNVEFKKFLWNDIADKIGSEKEFLRRRWTNLREKFVRVLRYNEVYADNFKYYGNMLFLKKHIHLRGVSTMFEREQSESHQLVYVDDDDVYHSDAANPKTEIIESISQDGSNAGSENFEFTITEEHINNNSDTEEVIFVELKSDDEETSQVDKKRKLENSNSNTPFTKEVSVKKSCFSDNLDEEFSTDRALQADRQFNSSYQDTPNGHCLENRCEDQIFGELVTAMLLKMDPKTKRKMKKEIMNVLLK